MRPNGCQVHVGSRFCFPDSMPETKEQNTVPKTGHIVLQHDTSTSLKARGQEIKGPQITSCFIPARPDATIIMLHTCKLAIKT